MEIKKQYEVDKDHPVLKDLFKIKAQTKSLTEGRIRDRNKENPDQEKEKAKPVDKDPPHKLTKG